MPVRAIAPHPRVDSVRGCVALARGPVVYCIEQADHATDVAVEDLRLDPAAPPQPDGADDGLGVPVTLAGSAPSRRARRTELYGGSTPPAPTGATEATLTARIPYYRWANRGPEPHARVDPDLEPSRRRVMSREGSRRCAVLATVAACAGAVGACGGGGDDSRLGAAAAARPAGTMTIWARDTQKLFMGKLVDAYNKSHKAQAKVSIIPSAQFVQKFGTAAASGNAPDIASIDLVFLPYFASQGALEDITELARRACRTRTS